MDFKHAPLELYLGTLYPSNRLPWHFVPFLMLVQFSEPVILFSILGVGRILKASQKWWYGKEDLIFVFMWLALPLGAQIILRPTVYNNFRQLLFITVPLFVLSAIGLEGFFSRFKQGFLRLIVVALVVLPGIVAIAKLHPYEYVYYNELVGGVDGAYERYEMDYWCTSYREGMTLLNEVAPTNASIGIHRWIHLAQPFARSDLQLVMIDKEADVDSSDMDYVLICSRSNYENTFLEDTDTYWRVERVGATMAVVKKLK